MSSTLTPSFRSPPNPSPGHTLARLPSQPQSDRRSTESASKQTKDSASNKINSLDQILSCDPPRKGKANEQMAASPAISSTICDQVYI